MPFGIAFLSFFSSTAPETPFFRTVLGPPFAEEGGRAWDERAEVEFASFVRSVARGHELGRCSTLSECLADPKANPLLEVDDPGFRFESDCADAVFILRAYFAHKSGRPFLFRVTRGLGQREIRETRALSEFSDFGELVEMIRSRIGTWTFHVGDESETYPVRVSRGNVRPGTLFYDGEGHVLMVYEVRDDGGITFFDSQPNGLLGLKRIMDDMPEPGPRKKVSGFRGWRPLEWSMVGDAALGRWSFVPDERLPELHLEGGLHSASSEAQDPRVGYWETVRDRLSISAARASPLAEFEMRLAQLCDDVRARGRSIDLAVAEGLHLREWTPEVPRDPFRSSQTEWMVHATPGRDLSLRRSLRALRQLVADAHRLASEGSTAHVSPRKSSDAGVRAFQTTLSRVAQSPACRFEFRGSGGVRHTFSLRDLAARAYDLSFNPYHCPELRWGLRVFDSADAVPAECEGARQRRTYLAEESVRTLFEKGELHKTADFDRKNPENLDFFEAVLSPPRREGH